MSGNLRDFSEEFYDSVSNISHRIKLGWKQRLRTLRGIDQSDTYSWARVQRVSLGSSTSPGRGTQPRPLEKIRKLFDNFSIDR